MKFSTVFFAAGVAGAALNANGALSDKEILDTLLENPHLLPPSSYKMLQARVGLQKRQIGSGFGGLDFGAILQGLGGMLGGSKGNSNAPESTVAEVQQETKTLWPGAKRTKIRYGPYRIPPISEKNLESQLLKVDGMTNTFKMAAKKPCTGQCTVLGLKADLEYADGKQANNEQGAWLHHVVLLNTGASVVDGNCGTSKIDNMFMSGNERSLNGYGLPDAEIKSGYRIFPDNSFVLTTQLMNMKDQEQYVWVTISYEYLDGHFDNYKDGRMVWMSIGGLGGLAGACGGARPENPWGASNLTLSQQPKSKVFVEHSMPWKAPRDGWILATGGHMHDGGVLLEIVQNQDVICKSEPVYTAAGEKGHAMKKRQVMGDSKSNEEIAHIKKQDGCQFLKGKPMKKGDTLYIKAAYDFNKFAGMKNKHGELDEVMGISGSVMAF